MNSRIIIGKLMHARLEPVAHNFTYPLYCYAFDLDELEELDKKLSLFGHNRIRPVALHDADYLTEGSDSIRAKLLTYLRAEGFDREPGRIMLITAARYCNYVFNPVSFYYCYDTGDELSHVVAEVNNTFRERHLYLLHEGGEPARGFQKHYTARKEFHVSPFNDMQGEYRFLFSDLGDTLDIRLDLVKSGRTVFKSRLSGDTIPLQTGTVLKTLLRYPFTASLSMPRIIWQAAQLRYRRKLRHYPKPAPSSRFTIRVAPPRRHERWAMEQIFKVFRRFEQGSLTVLLPEGEKHHFGEDGTGLRAQLNVNHYRLFWRIVTGGNIAFGDAYVENDWQSEDPVAVLSVLAENKPVIERRNQALSFLKRQKDRTGHMLRKNTRGGSRKNIFDHYDIGNDFFSLFLDPTMTYSCALFQSTDDSLEEAQRNKLRSIIEAAKIRAEDHVVEIGCGWGSFSIEAVRHTGCRVTGITISEAQKTLAEARIEKEGLGERIAIKLCDYRDLTGTFDKLVSIEMLEAVGHKYFGRFFEVCDRVLKPDGTAVIQTITIPDERYEMYRRRADWIQKRIFPGGLVPSLGALTEAIQKHSKLEITRATNIGPQYGRTLSEWRRLLRANAGRVLALGYDDRFLRTWEYYFAYCEAGFATGLLGDHQLVLRKSSG